MKIVQRWPENEMPARLMPFGLARMGSYFFSSPKLDTDDLSATSSLERGIARGGVDPLRSLSTLDHLFTLCTLA